jgi:formylglycine-generating enzyme required for sulfatase activity
MQMSRVVAGACMSVVLLAWTGRAHAADDELSLDLGGTSLELRRIPKGTYGQGSAPGEVGRDKDELVRTVTISRSFWLGKIPVTCGQFARFVAETQYVTDAEKGAGGHGFDAKTGTLVLRKEFTWRNPGFAQRDEDPVVLVSFADANAFAAWASRKTGRRIRLPTEAEWEYAARAGTTTPWYGATREEEALNLGWFKANSGNGTHPVGLKKPNAWGLFDMAGNVFEWCRDVYAPFPLGDAVDPERIRSGAEPERRVLRGGSWLRNPKRGRSSARHKAAPSARSAEYGFRVAADDDMPTPSGLVPGDAGGAALAASSETPPADEQAQAEEKPPRPSAEGSPWTLVVAPFVGAGAAVGWVLARRGRHRPEVDVQLGEGVAGAPPPPSTAPPVFGQAPAVTRGLEALSRHERIGPPTPAHASPPSMPFRPALVDKRESESPLRAPLITSEEYVEPTSTKLPAAEAKPLEPEPAEVERSEPKPPEPKPEEEAEARSPAPPKSSAKMAAQKAAELKAFEAWISAAKVEAKASEAKLRLAQNEQKPVEVADPKLSTRADSTKPADKAEKEPGSSEEGGRPKTED